MPSLEEVLAQLRQFRRTSKLVVSRVSAPAAGEDYFVHKLEGGGTSNAVEITDLRVKFNVERNLKSSANKCDVQIYNLSRDGRAAVETKHLYVEMFAGHADVNRLVFAGDVIFAMSKLEPPDWVTMLQVGDGARALGNARASISYSKTTTVKQVVRDICKSMGQTLPSNIEASHELDAQMGSGGVVLGSSRDALSKVIAPYGFDASIQNGRLQLLKLGETSSDVHDVNESNGMIGSPEFGQPHRKGKPPTMSVRMLLRPEIVPGSRINLKSQHKSGLFKVTKVQHEGDTHDPTWFTEVDIKPVSG